MKNFINFNLTACILAFSSACIPVLDTPEHVEFAHEDDGICEDQIGDKCTNLGDADELDGTRWTAIVQCFEDEDLVPDTDEILTFGDSSCIFTTEFDKFAVIADVDGDELTITQAFMGTAESCDFGTATNDDGCDQIATILKDSNEDAEIADFECSSSGQRCECDFVYAVAFEQEIDEDEVCQSGNNIKTATNNPDSETFWQALSDDYDLDDEFSL